ncbi:hypothetical protein DERF_010509 [Dermatophagoides farinae]|uniref:Uncharacterized protein n=1 Tax=Dermatophagoides farinae TaxID=6954 RepID=A0A922HW20_DERFA|nr:hypothetical protein DERF_010509 [Dermatophagoides farinae]
MANHLLRKIIVFNIDEGFTEEQYVNMIKKENAQLDISDEDMKVYFTHRTSNKNEKFIVLVVSPRVFDACLRMDRLLVNKKYCTVKEYQPRNNDSQKQLDASNMNPQQSTSSSDIPCEQQQTNTNNESPDNDDDDDDDESRPFSKSQSDTDNYLKTLFFHTGKIQ